MFPELFDKELISNEIIIANLREYLDKIGFLAFDRAKQIAETNLELLDKEKNSLEKGGNGTRLNQIYVIRQFLLMLRDYSVFWDEVVNHKFATSWNTLQDIQDGLRVLKKYCGEYQKLGLNILENQIVTLEKLYPYKIFASSELVISDVKCSICGKSIDGLECPHISGELYDGEIAYGIVGKIEIINAVALVEHPLDKRCVIQIENTKTNFSSVAYLAELMNEHDVSPWNIKSIEETTRKKRIDEFGKIACEDDCPCGSGKHFKDCCLDVGYIVVPHLIILLSETRPLVI